MPEPLTREELKDALAEQGDKFVSAIDKLGDSIRRMNGQSAVTDRMTPTTILTLLGAVAMFGAYALTTLNTSVVALEDTMVRFNDLERIDASDDATEAAKQSASLIEIETQFDDVQGDVTDLLSRMADLEDARLHHDREVVKINTAQADGIEQVHGIACGAWSVSIPAVPCPKLIEQPRVVP